MRFTTNDKTKMLDFIIGLECFDEKFLLRIEKSFQKIETIEFYTIYKKLYSELSPHYFDIKTVFVSPYYPLLQSIYRKLNNKQNIENIDEFVAETKTLTEKDVKDVIKLLANVDVDSSDEDTKTAINELNTYGENKYYLLKAFDNPKEYLRNARNLITKLYPIFLNHYTNAEKIFAKKIADIKLLDAETINDNIHNLLGSEKLTHLHSKYKHVKKLSVKEIEQLGEEIKIAPLLFGANRLVLITKSDNVNSKSFNITKNSEPLYCVGIDMFDSANKLAEAEEISKKVLRALADDTRFDILRMISYGVNTNKKLSELFCVSPPAITYQTNMLKEAEIIDLDNNGQFFVKKDKLEEAFKKINSLLSISNRDN